MVDIGALNGRAIYVDERGKVLSYKMTSQCASGSGQFLENIARYLGVAIEEIGPLSKSSTDAGEGQLDLRRAGGDRRDQHGLARHRDHDILKGIHLSMASRIVKLLKVTGIKTGTALLTGGLALDTGLLAAIQEEMANEKITGLTAVSHPDSIYAGAVGAALVGRVSPWQAAGTAAARRSLKPGANSGMQEYRSCAQTEKRRRFTWHC